MTSDDQGWFPRKIEPENHLQDTLDLFGRVSRQLGSMPAELFRREAETVRLVRSRQGRYRSGQSRDVGMALRLSAGESQGWAHGSTTGDDAFCLDRLTARTRASHGRVLDEDSIWNQDPGQLVDCDEEPLPTYAELETWMETAWSRLEKSAARLGAKIERTQLEIARTVETWAATPGAASVRARLRTRAVAEMIPSPESAAASEPLRLATRGWSRLDEAGWAELVADQVWPTRSSHGSSRAPDATIPLLLAPSVAARWVQALLRVRHIRRASWQVVDHPGREGALYGASFDDAGYPSADRVLLPAAAQSGEGRLIRGSYRDWPQPIPLAPAVEAEEASLPNRAAVVSRLEFHPVSPDRWWIEFDGGWLVNGAPAGAFRGATRSGDPGLWAEQIVGSFGDPVAHATGILCPALLWAP